MNTSTLSLYSMLCMLSVFTIFSGSIWLSSLELALLLSWISSWSVFSFHLLPLPEPAELNWPELMYPSGKTPLHVSYRLTFFLSFLFFTLLQDEKAGERIALKTRETRNWKTRWMSLVQLQPPQVMSWVSSCAVLAGATDFANDRAGGWGDWYRRWRRGWRRRIRILR